MRLPKAPDAYDTSNEQQARRALESAMDDVERKLATLLTSSGTLAANVQNLTAVNGSNNDLAVGYGTYTRISGPTAAFTLTGLAGGEAGRVLLLRNTTTYNMILANESGSSTGKNRILTQTGTDVTLDGSGGCSALLFYDGASERWILVAGDAGLFLSSGGVLTHAGTPAGLIPVEQVFCLNADLAGANATGAQSVFGVGCSLSASTRYGFEIVAALTKSAGTTSHTIALSFGGTATFNAVSQTVIYHTAAVVAGGGAGAFILHREVGTSLVHTVAITTANNSFRFVASGTLSVNTAGTFIPQYTLSAAPGGAYSTEQGSFIRVWPLGASGANISIGTWA